MTDASGGREWKGPSGESAVAATAQHVMCGECVVDEGDMQRHRRMVDAVSAVARETQIKKRATRGKKGGSGGRARRQQSSGGGDGGVHAATRNMAGVARRALGKKEAWTAVEGEAVRRMVAGDMPVPGARQEGKAAKRIEIAVATAVRQLQHAMAEVREAWRRASAQEVARRREERAGEELRRGVVWRWIVANRTADTAKERIWKAWQRHRARTDWEARATERSNVRRQQRVEEERSEEHTRTEAWQGRQDMASTRGELRGERRGRTGEEGPEGWTMAAALIMYKKGAQRRTDVERVRQAKEARKEEARVRKEKESSGEGRSGEAREASGRQGKRTRDEATLDTGDGLAGEEEAGIGDGEWGGRYAGLVRGLKRVLLEEVARYAIREYHGIQHGGRGTRGGGEGGPSAREARGEQQGQGGARTHGDEQQEAASSAQHAGRAAAAEGGEERGTDDSSRSGKRQREEGEDEGESGIGEEQDIGPHERTGHGREERKRTRQEAAGREADSTREAHEKGEEGARTRGEGTHGEEEMGTGDMRGKGRAHERKQQKKRQDATETSTEVERERGWTRARERGGHEAEERVEDMEVESTGQESSMRPTERGKGGSARHENVEEDSARSDDGDGGAEGRTASDATPQREEGEEREQATSTQQSTIGPRKEEMAQEMGHTAQAVNRPKRKNRGQPVYFARGKKQRTTTNGGRRKKGAARVRYIDNSSGKGRVALEGTVAVGRVYMERMERQVEKVRDAGRPPGDPG